MKSQSITISVITVVLNAKDIVEETVKSVISQSHNDIEYIVIDGGSIDGTLDVLNKYNEGICKLLVEPDTGIYDAMNKALNLAIGDFCIFVNAGDFFYDQYVVENVVKSIQDLNTIYYGNVLWCSERDSFVYGGKFNLLKLCLHNICHQSIFYPKSAYSVYRFDLRYKIVADYYYNLLLKSNFKFVYIDEIICCYHAGISALKEDSLFSLEKDVIIKKHYNFVVYYIYLFFKHVKIRRVFDKFKFHRSTCCC